MYKIFLVVYFLIGLVKPLHTGIYKRLTTHHGVTTKLNARRLETLHKRLTKQHADVDFLKSCLAFNILPKFVHVKLFRPEHRYHRKHRSYQRSLIKAELHQKLQLIKSTEDDILQLEHSLATELTWMNWYLLRYAINKTCTILQRDVTNKHNKKLSGLGIDRDQHGLLNTVTNLSSRSLTTEEMKVLQKGNGKIIHLSGENDGNGDGWNSTSKFTISGQEFNKAFVKEDDFFQVAMSSRAKKSNKDHKYSPIAQGREIVRRARDKLGEIGYNVIWKNCEHFAAWCRYGKSWSEQVDTVLTWAAVGTAVGGLALMAMGMSKQRANKN